MRLTYLSSFYILIWMILQLQIRMGLFIIILLTLALLDWFKQLVFVFKKDTTAKCLTSNKIFPIAKILNQLVFFLPLIAVFFASFSLSSSIWGNLFPSICLLLPVVLPMGRRRYNPEPFLTRFQISNWLCMCMWMVSFFSKEF